MIVAFRVDASFQMGTGHIMRCLTLADALQKQGSEVSFICREHKGNLIKYIEKKGYVVYRLDRLFSEVEELNQPEINSLAHASWLGATQREDAQACDSIIKNINPDWLIVDHYAIDYRWQNQFKKTFKKLMVIDDLADRKHESDLLLDQTFGRKEEGYTSLVPQRCKLLLGSQYALLRPEFSQWRKYSLQRRAAPVLKKILITMGGVDPDNFTGQLLEMLRTSELRQGIEITVVMGSASPCLEDVKQLEQIMPCPTSVMVNVNNMAELMTNSDLAIGAVGSTTWERCCLGVPSILLAIAENQIYASQLLKHEKVIKLCDDIESVVDLVKIITKNDMADLSKKSANLTDGTGCNKVIHTMMEIG
jgi:UDP-2,4-diacetamido-2,4,6-trideoxy-beta-L-altropyranose hydrolase